MNITIDPGHSGPFEPGACAAGLTESEVVLTIALIAGDLLTAAGHNVLLTRTGNIETDDLAFRSDMANNQPADIFISIHINAADNPNASGTEVYHYPGSARGAYLADCIRKRIVASIGTTDRGTKEANFQVLRETNAPAVLVECGFITNDSDRGTFASPGGCANYATAIFRGVQDFCGQ